MSLADSRITNASNCPERNVFIAYNHDCLAPELASGMPSMSTPSKLRPLFILGAAVLVVAVMMAMRQEPEDRPHRNASPLVRVATATPSDYRFTVKANGAVQPRTESELIPKV
jgi:hypothetical protein